jgi:hypothetical protein
MYKIVWSLVHDPHQTVFILVPDAETLYEAYYALSNSTKVGKLVVTNLHGDTIDMKEGISIVASQGTCSRIVKTWR